jgi:hypothetical protein
MSSGVVENSLRDEPRRSAPKRATWVVPGAPLDAGRGWRIWYSAAGADQFSPAQVEVRRAGELQAIEQSWKLLAAADQLERRMGILTVTLADPQPGAAYELLIPELQGPVRWRSLPNSLDEPVTFLLSSCYWLPNDKEGAYGAAVRDLTKLLGPAFKLLIGDQLYQDYPMNWYLPRSIFELFADRYEEYWGNGAYQEVLQAAPNYFVGDDHEFWNDFPERQMQLPRTWRRTSREECAEAAQSLYHLYQRAANPDEARFYRFAIGDVSFFVSDARSERTYIDDPSLHFFSDEQWQALETWADELQGPGVFILAQPIFQEDGDWKDHSLSNFGENYGRLCQLIERCLTGSDGNQPHDILILTGDIHNARYTEAKIAGVQTTTSIHELVASPVSRVGPYVREAHAKPPPTKLRPIHQNRPSTWTVVLPESDAIPTIDNNVGTVTMSPGTNGRVRFNLTIWRIRPYDSRSVWERLFRQPQSTGGVPVPIYKKELQLR